MLAVIAASCATHRKQDDYVRRTRSSAEVTKVPFGAVDDLNSGLIAATVRTKLAGVGISHVTVPKSLGLPQVLDRMPALHTAKILVGVRVATLQVIAAPDVPAQRTETIAARRDRSDT